MSLLFFQTKWTSCTKFSSKESTITRNDPQAIEIQRMRDLTTNALLALRCTEKSNFVNLQKAFSILTGSNDRLITGVSYCTRIFNRVNSIKDDVRICLHSSNDIDQCVRVLKDGILEKFTLPDSEEGFQAIIMTISKIYLASITPTSSPRKLDDERYEPNNKLITFSSDYFTLLALISASVSLHCTGYDMSRTELDEDLHSLFSKIRYSANEPSTVGLKAAIIACQSFSEDKTAKKSSFQFEKHFSDSSTTNSVANLSILLEEKNSNTSGHSKPNRRKRGSKANSQSGIAEKEQNSKSRSLPIDNQAEAAKTIDEYDKSVDTVHHSIFEPSSLAFSVPDQKVEKSTGANVGSFSETKGSKLDHDSKSQISGYIGEHQKKYGVERLTAAFGEGEEVSGSYDVVCSPANKEMALAEDIFERQGSSRDEENATESDDKSHSYRRENHSQKKKKTFNRSPIKKKRGLKSEVPGEGQLRDDKDIPSIPKRNEEPKELDENKKLIINTKKLAKKFIKIQKKIDLQSLTGVMVEAGRCLGALINEADPEYQAVGIEAVYEIVNDIQKTVFENSKSRSMCVKKHDALKNLWIKTTKFRSYSTEEVPSIINAVYAKLNEACKHEKNPLTIITVVYSCIYEIVRKLLKYSEKRYRKKGIDAFKNGETETEDRMVDWELCFELTLGGLGISIFFKTMLEESNEPDILGVKDEVKKTMLNLIVDGRLGASQNELDWKNALETTSALIYSSSSIYQQIMECLAHSEPKLISFFLHK